MRLTLHARLTPREVDALRHVHRATRRPSEYPKRRIERLILWGFVERDGRRPRLTGMGEEYLMRRGLTERQRLD